MSLSSNPERQLKKQRSTSLYWNESFQQHSINQETNLKEGQFNIGKMNSLQL